MRSATSARTSKPRRSAGCWPLASAGRDESWSFGPTAPAEFGCRLTRTSTLPTIKMAATAGGFTLGAALLWARRLAGGRPRAAAWGLALGLAVAALLAAAPLRWYL